jgi:hypothetical protein
MHEQIHKTPAAEMKSKKNRENLAWLVFFPFFCQALGNFCLCNDQPWQGGLLLVKVEESRPYF